MVFSNQTLGNLMDADPVSAHTINAAFNHWKDIEIHFRGSTIHSSGTRAQVGSSIRKSTYTDLVTGTVKFDKNGDRTSARIYEMAIKDARRSGSGTINVTRP